ncbi:hypothetical protein [Streptomyces sp. NPDC006552]|uniref:hypothetical protein n=1 Tax=Streptomyces sp. NPDC006552 TaxID=3157179 RepID=UPI0033A370E1
MSHTPQPDPSQDLARRVGERLAANPAMDDFRRAVAEFALANNTRLSEAVQRFSAANNARFAEHYARVMAPAIQMRNEQLSSVMSSWAARLLRNMATHSPEFRLDVSRLDFDTVLSSPFDALPAEQREWARQVVEEATAAVDADAAAPDDVPDDMLEELSQAARSFAGGQPAELSWETKRTLFMWFWGVLVFLTLMQAQVQSETVKELMEDAGAAAPYVGTTVAAAAFVWNKTQPKPAEPDE